MKKNNHPLVCRFGTLADMVMIAPLIKRLHERSGLTVDLITVGEWNKALFEAMPYVRNVHTIQSIKTPYLLNQSKKDLAKYLKNHPHENVWICETNKKLIGLLNKVGITHKKSISPYSAHHLSNEHFIKHWMRLADMSPGKCNYPVPTDKQDENTELFVTNYETDVCRNWLATRGVNHKAPLICIQAGVKKRSSSIKYWPETHWAKVIDAVTENMPEAQVLLCGEPSDKTLSLEIKSLCKQQHNIFNVTEDLPLRKHMALLSISHSCISINNGSAHVAAALNCPLTVLIGKDDARVTSPKSSTSKVVLVVGRNFDIDLLDGEAAWKTAHDMSLITADAVTNGWKESVT